MTNRNQQLLISGIQILSSRFWNDASTLDVRLISKPTPIPFGIRRRGRTRSRGKPSSMTRIPLLSAKRCLRRYSRYASSAIAEIRLARSVCSPGFCTVPTAEGSSITARPRILKRGRIISSAPTIEAIEEAVPLISSELLHWKKSYGCI